MMKVKICGITNRDDARVAVAAGADMLGFNFYRKSPRYLSPDQAREIATPSAVRRVGVFVNETVEMIAGTVESANLNSVQLHGDMEETFVLALRRSLSPTVEVIRAFRLSPDFVIDQLRETSADAVLVDAFVPGEAGGTGVRCDWNIAKEAATTGKQMYLAGGLSPENVGDAIKEVRPFAVDACSLLESSPGHKDHEKVRRFIIEAKRHD
jgi:phosphoribosylanthranilate isomerase